MNLYDHPEIQSINYKLDKLDKISQVLNYTIPTAVLYGAAFFFTGLLIAAASLAAVVFTPFLVHTLYKCDRKGWLIGFVVIVGIPYLASLGVMPVSFTFGYILQQISLAFFFVYCFTLKIQVRDWIGSLNARLEYTERKLNKQNAHVSDDINDILGISRR